MTSPAGEEWSPEVMDQAGKPIYFTSMSREMKYAPFVPGLSFRLQEIPLVAFHYCGSSAATCRFRGTPPTLQWSARPRLLTQRRSGRLICPPFQKARHAEGRYPQSRSTRNARTKSSV